MYRAAIVTLIVVSILIWLPKVSWAAEVVFQSDDRDDSPSLTIERISKDDPLTTQLTWSPSNWSDFVTKREDNVLDHWVVLLSDSVDEHGRQLNPIEYIFPAETLGMTLSKIDGLQPLKQYHIRVREYYISTSHDPAHSQSDGLHYTDRAGHFCTGASRIKGLQLLHATANTVKIGWGEQRRVWRLNLNYRVKVYQAGNLINEQIVDHGLDPRNESTITGLQPNTEYSFKVQGFNDDTYRTGRWSKLYLFTTPTNQ